MESGKVGAPKIPEELWNKHKEQLRRLYLDDNWTLEEIVKGMQKNGFSATQAQYKRKFKKWGFFKYLKSEDWSKFKAEAEKRKAEGQVFRVDINGKEVSAKKLRKEFQRHPAPQPSLSSSMNITARTSSALVSSTSAFAFPSNASIRLPSFAFGLNESADNSVLSLVNFESPLMWATQHTQSFPGHSGAIAPPDVGGHNFTLPTLSVASAPRAPTFSGFDDSLSTSPLSFPTQSQTQEAWTPMELEQSARNNIPIKMFQGWLHVQLDSPETFQHALRLQHALGINIDVDVDCRKILELESIWYDMRVPHYFRLPSAATMSVISNTAAMSKITRVIPLLSLLTWVVYQVSNCLLGDDEIDRIVKWIQPNEILRSLKGLIMTDLPALQIFKQRIMRSACETRKYNLVRILLSSGVSPLQSLTHFGGGPVTPLRIAVNNDDSELVDILTRQSINLCSYRIVRSRRRFNKLRNDLAWDFVPQDELNSTIHELEPSRRVQEIVNGDRILTLLCGLGAQLPSAVVQRSDADAEGSASTHLHELLGEAHTISESSNETCDTQRTFGLSPMNSDDPVTRAINTDVNALGFVRTKEHSYVGRPIAIATWRNDGVSVKKLLQLGADPNGFTSQVDAKQFARDSGVTSEPEVIPGALFCAVRELAKDLSWYEAGAWDIFKILLQHQPRLADPATGIYILDYARCQARWPFEASSLSLAIARQLLHSGLNLEISNKGWGALLFDAIWVDSDDVFDHLLQQDRKIVYWNCRQEHRRDLSTYKLKNWQRLAKFTAQVGKYEGQAFSTFEHPDGCSIANEVVVEDAISGPNGARREPSDGHGDFLNYIINSCPAELLPIMLHHLPAFNKICWNLDISWKSRPRLLRYVDEIDKEQQLELLQLSQVLTELLEHGTLHCGRLNFHRFLEAGIVARDYAIISNVLHSATGSVRGLSDADAWLPLHLTMFVPLESFVRPTIRSLLQCGADLAASGIVECEKWSHWDTDSKVYLWGAWRPTLPRTHVSGRSLASRVTMLVSHDLQMGEAPEKLLFRATPVQAASLCQQRGALRLLVDAGADVNQPAAEDIGFTALQAAILGHKRFKSTNYENTAEEDFEEQINDGNINDKSWYSLCSLTEQLVKMGVDINAAPASKMGFTALQAAVLTGEQTLTWRLIKLGAAVNGAAASDIGLTALQAAVLKRQSVVQQILVEKLLDAGADVNAPAASVVGWTALQAALLRENTQFAQMLLDRGADVNALPCSYRGATALQYASMNGDIEMVQQLIQKGADVNAEAAAKDGRTALEGAAENGRLDTVAYLLSMDKQSSTLSDRCHKAARLADEQAHTILADYLRKRADEYGILQSPLPTRDVHDYFDRSIGNNHQI